jgi:Arc/MetJ-type ribon-helix-helix transcriptional regulator
MARAPRPKLHGHKIRVSVTLSPEIYEWAAKRVGPGADFASLSHAIERALVLLRERVK